MDLDPYLCFFNILLNVEPATSDLISLNIPGIGEIVAIIVAIFALSVSAFISGSETSFFSLTENDVESIEQDDVRSKISRLLSDPEKLLATILVTNNLVNVAIVILCNYVMSNVFVFNSDILDFVFQTVVLTFLLLLFGEILPKLYANNHNVKWAKFASSGLLSIYKFFGPVTKLITKSTSIVNKVVTKKSEDLSLDDLSTALEITDVEEGKEKNMLKEILKFGGKTVSEIMTPRVDIADVDWESSFEEVLELIRSTGYSRMPVYMENQDNMKGVIYAKDLLPYLNKNNKNFDWHKLLRDPFFVPETRMIDDILEDFRKRKIHMAIVVDEYGGTQGLVTLEDVLEEIVGEINDEYDDDESFYTRLSSDTFLFQGKTPLNDFFRVTGIGEDEFGDVEDDSETIAGLLLNIKHDFPKNKEIIEYGRCRFLIDDVTKHRINTVKVRLLAPTPEKNDN